MTANVTSGIAITRLPQLSEGWVFAYRLLWASLALTACLVVALGLYPGSASPAVEALRVAKTLILISVCAILLRRRARDPVAALLALAFLVWAITSSVDFASVSVLTAIGDRIRFLLFALAMLLFPDGSWRSGWARIVAAASVAVCVIGLAEGMGFSRTHLFLPLAVLCVLAALFSLIDRFRSAGAESVRQQLKWVALGLVAGIGSILVARAGAGLVPVSSQSDLPVLWEGLFQAGIIVIALGFLVSLLRYRLFDAETAITRSASYAMLTIALVVTFAGTEAAIEWFGQQYLGMSVGNLAAAVGAAVAAASLGPLHHRIGDWAEHRFQHDLVELKTQFPELLADLSAWASLDELGRAILERIGRAVHAAQLVLIVDGKVVASEGSPEIATELFLRLPAGMSGKLALGPRPDGTPQAREEIEALEAIIPALSRAVWTCAHRDRARRREQQFRRSVSKKLALLSERIGRSG